MGMRLLAGIAPAQGARRRFGDGEAVGYTAAGRRIGLAPTGFQRRPSPVRRHQRLAGIFDLDRALSQTKGPVRPKEIVLARNPTCQVGYS
jgi:hypothetical protein